MKRKRIWMGVVSLAIIATAAFIAASGGHPGRQLRAIIGGAPAVAYAEPRRTIAVTAGPPQPRVSPGEAGIDPAALAAAVEYAGARNTRALVVGRGGHIVFEKYWDDTTAESAVDASEFAPALSALLIGVAINDGYITGLDAPLSNYVNEWKDNPRGALTLRQLLVRESGLAAPGWPWPGTLASRYYISNDFFEALLEWPLDPAQPAGEAPADVSADLLSIVLNRTLGGPYETLLAKRIWEPIGGSEFSMGRDGNPSWRSRGRAGCCVRARIEDWMRIGEVLANDGVFAANQLTPPRFVSLMLAPTHKGSPMGFFTRVGGTFATRDVAWLEASGKQRLWVVPSLKLVILRVGDEPSAEKGWDEATIPDSIIRGTSGWAPAAAAEGIDPKNFAPH